MYLLGAVLFLVTGALVLDYISKYENRHSFENIHGYFGNDNYNGIITGIGLLCIVMVVLYIIDIVLVFKNQK